MATRYGFGVDNRPAVDVNIHSNEQSLAPLRINGVAGEHPQQSKLAMADSIMIDEGNDDGTLRDLLVDSGPDRAGEESIEDDLATDGTVEGAQRRMHLRLAARDMEAVGYSKNLLQEGDTLVFISYPENQNIYNSTGFIVNNAPHVVHSQTLLATGSKRFETLLNPSNQFRTLRRKKLANKLPKSIKYVLDLTPPDEGDEAVDLTTALSCSLGIRSWYSIQCRCNMRPKLVDGWDEVVAAQALPITARQLPEDTRSVSVAIEQRPSSSRLNVSSSVFGRSKQDLEEEHTRDMAEAILLSTEMASKLKQPVVDRHIPEYDPIRHRAGIARLLQVLEGKDPQLDSAPKVWTLVRLAEYFECTSSILDQVLLWILESPNQLFIEILPEAACKIGLTLECGIISRGSFAVLVSEEALSLVSRSVGKVEADLKRTNQFGRRLEDVDEDLKTRIEYASKSFADRLQRLAELLLDAACAWFDNCPEYRKLEQFKSALQSSPQMPEYQQWMAGLNELQSLLRHDIRGRILNILDQPLEQSCVTSSNKHRFLEHYHGDSVQAPSFPLYEKLCHKERVMTRFFWDMLRNMPCDIDDVNTARTNLPESSHNRCFAEYLIEPTSVAQLRSSQDGVNLAILAAIQAKLYANGLVPAECFGVLATMQNFVPVIDRFQGDGRSQNSDDRLSRDWSSDADEEVDKISRVYRKARFPDLPSPTKYDEKDKLDKVDAWTEQTPEIGATLPIRHKSTAFVPEKVGKVAASSPKPQDLTERQSTRTLRSGDDFSAMAVDGPTSGVVIGNANRDVPSPSETSFMGDSLKDKALRDYVTRHLPPDAIGIPAARLIGGESVFFSLHLFMLQVQDYIELVCSRLLETGDLGFDVTITDTLMCLDSREYKYLPLWAGGDDDGSGGVFENDIPSALAGPIGPGPSFHTGFSSASTVTSSVDDDSISRATFAHTSLAAENGFSDHLDRHRVISDDGFRSDTFSDDLDSYGAPALRKDESPIASEPASAMTVSDDVSSFEKSSKAGTERGDDSDFEIVDDSRCVARSEDTIDESENEMWNSDDAVQFESSDEDIDEDMDVL